MIIANNANRSSLSKQLYFILHSYKVQTNKIRGGGVIRTTSNLTCNHLDIYKRC